MQQASVLPVPFESPWTHLMFTVSGEAAHGMLCVPNAPLQTPAQLAASRSLPGTQPRVVVCGVLYGGCCLDRHVFLQEYQSKELPNSRIQPDRRWFGNTRVIAQKQLEQFREEMTAKVRSLLLSSCLWTEDLQSWPTRVSSTAV